MSGNICDCCGSTFNVSVHSSTLGPISCAYCEICTAVYAEPKDIMNGMVEVIGGPTRVNPNLVLIYYDPKEDNYKDWWTGKTLVLEIKEEGIVKRTFANRSELQDYLVTNKL